VNDTVTIEELNIYRSFPQRGECNLQLVVNTTCTIMY